MLMPWMADDLRKKNRAWLIKKISLSEIVSSKNNFIIQRTLWLFFPCVLSLLAFLSILYPSAGSAGVSDVIVGHVNDIKARLSDDQTVQGRVLKTGEIDTSAEGQDGLHWSSGNWSLVEVDGVLFLQSAENFRSSPAPDLHVYISENPAIKDNYQFSNDQYEIGPLLKPNGAAFYRLDLKDPKRVQSILIWCKRFSEYIGSADLK
jgi:hypothetical protein